LEILENKPETGLLRAAHRTCINPTGTQIFINGITAIFAMNADNETVPK
jgi:hypothetical protein